MWEKARFTGQAGIRKTSVVAVDVSKQVGWHRNRGRWIVPGRAWRVPVYRPGGARHGGDVSLVWGSCAEREKACPDTAALVWVVRGSVPGGGNREGLSTVAGRAG